MRKTLKRFFVALILFIGALGAALAEPRAPKDPFRLHANFSMAFPDGITVKNQDPVVGYQGKEYAYGDHCIPLSRGDFEVLERIDGYVIARYMAPEADVARDECPNNTITTFRVKELETMLSLLKAREDEDSFYKELQRRMLNKGDE